MKLEDVDRTLIRYLNDNIPIEDFQLGIGIENQDLVSHAEKWIRPVVSKPCLKIFYLYILLHGGPFTLPDEILSGENLTEITIISPLQAHSLWMTKTTPNLIKCVSLRELHLDGVRISEETLDHILSSCSLLEIITLFHSCHGFKTIKVKHLLCLKELTISPDDDRYVKHSTSLEISNVPNLGLFICDLHFPFNAPSISLGSNVTQLDLGGGMVTDNACLHMIESGFPFLESLTLNDMKSWIPNSFHFTSATMKRLSLRSCKCTLIRVHAPNLHFFRFDGPTLPSLMFPVSTLSQILVILMLKRPVDVEFFVKMREVFALSGICDVRITTSESMPPLYINIDIDDLRTRLVLPPAKNVQELWFQTTEDECMWERSSFFDAFFEICHPKLVYAWPDVRFRHNNHFCKVMLKEFLEKKKKTMITGTTTTLYWPEYLKDVRIKQGPYDQEWETLTNSHRSLLDGSTCSVYMHFKLKWG